MRAASIRSRIARFTPSTGDFGRLTDEEGLPSNDVLGILEDRAGDVFDGLPVDFDLVDGDSHTLQFQIAGECDRVVSLASSTQPLYEKMKKYGITKGDRGKRRIAGDIQRQIVP